VIDKPDALKGDSHIADFGGKLLSVLPPRDQPGGALLGLLRNPLFGLPEQVEFPESSYKPKLTLDYVAPPQIGVGVDRFGTYAGGGVGLYWGDMLGYHSLGTIVQSSSRLKDLTGIVSYQNSRSRMNWGGVVGRIPYVYGGYNVYWDPESQAYIEDELLYWQINYQLSGYLAYPINQAQRVEMYAGYQYIDFDNERITQAYTFDGYPLYRDVTKLPSPESIHYIYTTLALVYDSALFGATAPILGQSYMLEAMPTYGNFNMYTIMADYRRYFMPVRPFTIAFRALHYGRYGRDAEDQRMYPLYIGYESLVRGYDYYSYSFDNTGGGSGDFTQSRLYGSKMLVANAELRFPLFGALGVGKGYYGVFPIDMVLFYDWGVAWYADSGGRNNKPTFLGGNREPVSSAGIGVRVNVFGYLVVGVNFVKPFDRPDKGWYFQFSFWPGF
jgi:Omp85 superfamily domain